MKQSLRTNPFRQEAETMRACKGAIRRDIKLEELILNSMS